MKPAQVIALGLIPFLAVGGAVLATLFQRVRDVFFFLLVTLAVFAERVDVNFFSRAWYRGTTRGIEISLLDILAFSLLVGCWLGRHEEERRRFWPASLGVMLLYLAYASVSVIASDPRLFAVFELSKIFRSIVVFLAAAIYARTQREWTLLLIALGCVVGLEGLWAVKQHLFTRLNRVVGSLDHANSLSMYLCLTVPPLVAAAFGIGSRALRWFCAVAAALGAVALLLTFSRAGLPVFAVVVLGTVITCASWQLSTSRIIIRTVIAIAVVALVAALWPKIEQRYAEATLQEEYFDASVDGRGIYLRLARMIVADDIYGVGLNNWSYHVSRTYGPRLGFNFMDYDHLVSIYGTQDLDVYADSYLAAPAHNLAALTLGELGVPGLVIFTLLWLRWFSMGVAFLPLPRADPMRILGVGLFFGTWGIFGQSLTEWVYRQTPILFTFYILLGVLASLTAARRRIRREERAIAAAPAQPVRLRVPEEHALQNSTR